VEIAFKMLWGIALIAYGARGLYRRQIGWSIGPILTTTITGIPGALFGAACVLGGALLAVPLGVALVTNQSTETLFIHVATYIGLPVAVIGLMLAIFVQMALDLGGLIRKLRGHSEG
jgi:hypothetical protein